MLRNMMLLSLALMAMAVAGTVAVSDERGAAAPGAAPMHADAMNQKLQGHIANSLLLGNQEEIALCEFALDRTENPKVKAVIQKMMEEHTQFVAELKKFTPKGAMFEFHGRHKANGGAGVPAAANPRYNVAPANPPQTNVPQTTVPQANVPQTAPPPAAGQPTIPPAAGQGQPATGIQAPPPQANLAVKSRSFSHALFELEHDAVQESLAMTQETLDTHKGIDFDKAFLGQQLVAHIGMLAKLKAAEKKASGDFQALIRKGQENAKMHKHHIEQAMAELAGTTRTSGAEPATIRE